MKNNTSNGNLYPAKLLILSLVHIFFLLVPIICYTPIENIAINCGSLGTSDNDNRTWSGDIGSSLSPLEQIHSNKSQTYLSQKQPTTTVPYFSARLSYSEFTYTFNVTAGPKFIRLHFYPNVYQDFDTSRAFFSVKANSYTLLSNFSAYLAAASLGIEVIDTEYVVNVEEDQRLNITFFPVNSSFAFINGIEVVSMPNHLYYTSTDSQPPKFIGHEQNTFSVENNTALETVYRLNVGGNFISSRDDTMFRSWFPDDGYVSVIGALPENSSINPSFTKIPNYTAPALVYKTARSMGNNKIENEEYNLTWNFPLDSKFTYLVRLHFCEFQPEITKPGDREFKIFLANQTAEDYADVITWSGGNGIPVYEDYAVVIVADGATRGKRNLSLALHPGSEDRTKYSDAILNGVEVFKLSDNVDNLAGPNPDPLKPPKLGLPFGHPTSKGKKGRIIIVLAPTLGGGLLFIVAIFLLGFLIYRRRTKGKKSESGKRPLWGSNTYKIIKSSTGGGGSGSSSLPSNICHHFSLAEIKMATNGFDQNLIIGSGGFGDVYKGYINSWASTVAIKRLKQESPQGFHEFKTEIEMLSQLRHLHLVSLIGYCNDQGEMILVYDYMSHGTLRDHLYNTDNQPLSWKQRLLICVGAARGIDYLHSGLKHKIIHRDVKTTNILLDEKWVAKVSDFGLSKINLNDTSTTHISTAVKGSYGYLDPEYYRRQQLTEKSDVYSFGVVLLEVLCARPPFNKELEKDQINLAIWAQECYENGTIHQIIDPRLMGKIAPECLNKFEEIAMRCLLDEGTQRPSMNDVVWALEFALQLQESAEGNELAEAPIQVKGDSYIFDKNGGLVDDQEQVSSIGLTSSSGNDGTTSTTSADSNKMSSGVVFSELMNPTAR